jgi:mono/diheme cytochrome c family protein
LGTQQLVQLLGDERKWYREHARRLLGERQDRSLVPELRQIVRDRRGVPALEALWTANLMAPIDPAWTSELLAHPDAAVRAWALRLFRPAGPVAPSMRDTLVRLARTEPDAEVRSELANTTARLTADAALAVLGALAEREEDVSDRHIPLRIWWALEQHVGSEPDAVLSWVETSGVWHAPVFSQHIAGRLARRLTTERGDTQTFTRIDPDGNWKAYAEHPRTLMPGGKGDYTDWQSNETPEVRERNLRRLARLMQSAPTAADRDRLLAAAGAADTTRAAAPVDSGAGREAFLNYCAPCHQSDGAGMARLAASLRNSTWVLGREDLLARIVLNGLKGELLMPPMGTLSDQQLAAILTYIRSAWGHAAAPVSPETVAQARAASAGRQTPWTAAELSALGR